MSDSTSVTDQQAYLNRKLDLQERLLALKERELALEERKVAIAERDRDEAARHEQEMQQRLDDFEGSLLGLAAQSSGVMPKKAGRA